MTPPPTGTREWCDGLPLVGIRPLTAAERDELQRAQLAQNNLCVLWACMVPVAGVGAAMLATSFSKWILAPIGTTNVLGEALLFLLIALPAYCFLRANDAGGRARLIRQAINANSLSIYALEPGATHSNPPYAPSVGSFEVLTASRFLWTVNGQRVKGYTTMSAVQLSDVPSSAHTAAAWTPPMQSSSDHRAAPATPPSAFNRRQLTPQEQSELLRYTKGWKVFLWFPILWGVCVAGAVANAFLAAPPLKLMPAFWGGLVELWGIFQAWILWNRSRKLTTDCRGGEVVVVRRPAADDNPDWPIDVETLEFLPASGLVWTQNSQVAPWRKYSE